MPYNELDAAQMAWALEYDIRVSPSLKDFYCGSWNKDKDCNSTDEHAAINSTITKWKSHRSTLFWYVNDELDVVQNGPALRDHARWVRELDPGHPSWAVVDEISEISQYVGAIDSAVCIPILFVFANYWRDGGRHSRYYWHGPISCAAQPALVGNKLDVPNHSRDWRPPCCHSSDTSIRRWSLSRQAWPYAEPRRNSQHGVAGDCRWRERARVL